MELTTKPRRWENSLAIILPKLFVESTEIRENEEITIEIKKKPTAKRIFGIFPN
jgi:antitoxin component of MazEF toxin-antitoxin module